ncbi:M50 family metallopeptidase [Saccharopolyspora taberi]|uniref:M50 family metallopeptidase n=1 Tax=Saccharopolyspora taberi TaxID=60895 RepID=A0ABN3V857_9PSEU
MSEQGGAADFGERLGQILATATTPPSWWMVLVMASAGVGLSLPGSRFHQANLLGLIVHEAGHAAAALITGGRVEIIELTGTRSGVTWTWNSSGFPSVMTSLAGYAAPPLAGLGVAALLASGKAPLVLGFGVVLAVLVLLVSRDLITIGLVLAFGVTMALVLWFAAPAVQVWFACAVLGLLLTHSAVRVPQLTAEWFRTEPGEQPEDNDAVALYRETGVTPYAWLLVWAVWIGFCWWKAASWLLWPM